MSFKYRIHCGCKNTMYVNNNSIIDAYYNEIKNYPLLTEEEEKALVCQYNNADTEKERTEAKNKLINSNLRFVISIVKKMGTNETFLDLINEGNIGLIKAIEKFDIEKDCRLCTYAVSWIVAYIQSYQMTQLKTVVPPNSMKLHNYIKRVSKSFFELNEREPTPHEIADMVREKFNFRISNLEDVELGRIISIDEKFTVDRDSDTYEDSCIYNRKTSSNNIDNNINEEYKRHQLEFFLGKLDERERYIIEKYYGIGCVQESFDTIAMNLKIGGERVRQICRSAVTKMRKYKKMVD